MEELWKCIPQYKGYYMVSSEGRIKTIEGVRTRKDGQKFIIKEKILKPRVHRQGYLKIILSLNSECRSFFIHRLVAIAFLKQVVSKNQVNHIDGDKSNNYVSNLEWVDQFENMSHALSTGLKKKARQVNQYNINGGFIKTYTSAKQAGIENGINCFSNILNVCSGRAKTAYGYKWAYA